MPMVGMNPGSAQSGMIAAVRVKMIADNCPLVIGMADHKNGARTRLVLNWDSLKREFKSAVETAMGVDAMGQEVWKVTKNRKYLNSFLDITSMYSMYVNVIPPPANNLIVKGNSMAEFLADLMESEEGKSPAIKNIKLRKQINVFLTEYRNAYRQLQEFLSEQILR